MDNRLKWDYPMTPATTWEINVPPAKHCKDVDVPQSVRLDVSGANEAAELIYLLSSDTSCHPNYLPRWAL